MFGVKPLRVVTIGLGGYAADHIRAAQWLAKEKLVVLAGVVALQEDRKNHPGLAAALSNKGVKLYENIEHFLATDTQNADILMVAVGIHQHVPVSIAAMQRGLHVFCEKPVAGSIRDVDRLIAAQKETGKNVAIGFQYLMTHAIRELKSRICDGRLGRVKAVRLMCCWPRSENYFLRNKWAGKMRIGEAWILDSPANNAHAHFLFNLLYLASDQPDYAAEPLQLRAELYRANRIESTDLTQLRFTTTDGASCFVVLSHCGWERLGPIMVLDCENGQAVWQGDYGDAVVTYSDGRYESFVNSRKTIWRYEIVRDFALSILTNREPICPPGLARVHTQAINAMHTSCPEIFPISEEFVIEAEGIEDYPPRQKSRFRRVKNHDAAIRLSFEQQKFFSELTVPWADQVFSREIATQCIR